MPGFGRPCETGCIHERGRSDMLATPEGDEPFGDKGSIETMQRDNVGNRAQRYQMKQ
jgi:hypothetical protein